MLWCLAILAGCSTPSTKLVKPEPPDSALLEACPAPPKLPVTDAPLREWEEILAKRAAAAAVCRARHRELADYVRRVTGD
jgi:hypothetical protein